MKNVSRIVAVATISALAVAAPATANAKPNKPGKPTPPASQTINQGVASNVTDAANDVASFTEADVPEHLAEAADIKQVQVQVKKDAVQVVVRGAFEAPEASGIGTFIGAGLMVSGGPYAGVSLQTAANTSFPAGYASNCDTATGVADFARDRVVLTVPRACLDGATTATVYVTTEAWDLADDTAVVYDSLDRQPVVRFGHTDTPAKPGKGNANR